MPKVAYDVFALPLVERLTLLNANLLYDTGVSPIQLKGWYEPNYKIGLKYNMDGQIYLDDALTLGLFASAVPPHPTTGAYAFFVFTFTKQALVGLWLGKTTSNYDTPVIVAINKTIGALLVYNASSQTVQVNHRSSIYPNYETDGTYSAGVVTLNAGQYALFYGATKPTVNTAAKWGFTDYEPKSSTTQPTTYIDLTDGTTHRYYEQTLAHSAILHYGIGAYVIDVNGAKLSSIAILNALMTNRGGYAADGLEYFYQPLDGASTLYMNQALLPIYDHDPIAGVSWAQGYTPDNIVYVRDNSGFTYISRQVKSTVTPYNPRYSFIVLQRYEVVDAQTVKARMLLLAKALTTVTSYGSVNQVINPGFALYHHADPNTFKYYNPTLGWVTATPGSGSYNYYDGYGVEASIYNPLNVSEVYAARYVMRKQLKYGSPPIKVGAITLTTGRGSIGVFQDYAGSEILEGNYIGFIVDGLIRKDNVPPTISTETPPDDTAVWSYLYGYPYNISVSAPSSAAPGQLVTVTVTTNAPDGRKVYVVDKDNDQILGSGTVSGGQATIQFNMPNRNLNIRVYVEGADIALA